MDTVGLGTLQFFPNLSPHHAKRGVLNCLEEQPEVQAMKMWEAHMCFQVAHGQRTLADRRQGSSSSGCRQDAAKEVSHHFTTVPMKRTLKRDMSAQPHVTPGYSPEAGIK